MLDISTTSVTPWFSKRWSSSLGVSKASAYWNPEQPPPRTATRRACSAPFSCSPSSSLILVAALSVSAMGSGVSFIDTDCRAPSLGARRLFVFGVVRPIQVLQDPAGVVDHLVAVDQDRHVGNAGEL